VVETRMDTQVEFGVSKSVECDAFCFQYADAVGWAIGMASGLFKSLVFVCWW